MNSDFPNEMSEYFGLRWDVEGLWSIADAMPECRVLYSSAQLFREFVKNQGQVVSHDPEVIEIVGDVHAVGDGRPFLLLQGQLVECPAAGGGELAAAGAIAEQPLEEVDRLVVRQIGQGTVRGKGKVLDFAFPLSEGGGEESAGAKTAGETDRELFPGPLHRRLSDVGRVQNRGTVRDPGKCSLKV